MIFNQTESVPVSILLIFISTTNDSLQIVFLESPDVLCFFGIVSGGQSPQTSISVLQSWTEIK